MHFVAPEQRFRLRREALHMQRAEPALCANARNRAGVAGEAGLFEAGLNIAVKRIESVGFDPHIQLIPAGSIEAAQRAIGEHAVIGVGIDRAGQPGGIFLPGAVVSSGQQEAAQNAALGVEGGAGIFAKIAVKPFAALHIIGHATRAYGTFHKANQRPFLCPRHDPAIDFLPPRNLAIDEAEFQMQRAANHRGGEFDQRNPVIALNRPGRAGGTNPGDLLLLQPVQHSCAFIRSIDADRAGNPGAHWSAMPVGQADRDDRA